ncbi:MAG TPA: CBS domain-containing protein [Kofleriaceae bacterium]
MDKGRTVYTSTPTATVFAAIAAMNDRRIGALLVIEAGAPLGILTERDVLRMLLAELDPKVTAVRHVMTRNPITVRSDTHVGEAMQIMTEHRCRHLPVVDDGELQGLISIGDLTNWVVRDQQRRIDDLYDFIRAA